MDQRADLIQQPTRLDLFSLIVCLIGNFFLRAAAASAGTLISLYLASLQQAGHPIRAEVVGLAAMLFYAAELLGSPGFGYLCDLWARKPFMILGPVFGGAAVSLIFIAPTIPLVLLARVLQGLSTASSVPSTLSYLSSESGSSEKRRGRVMGVFEIATIVGIAAGFAAGGILWDVLGHDAFLAVIGIYGASLLLLSLVRDRNGNVPRARVATHSRFEVLRSGRALSLVPAWIAVNAIVGLWFSHLDFQMGKSEDPLQLLVGGYSGVEIGLYTAGFSLIFVVGVGLWSLAFGRLLATQVMGISLGGLAALVAVMYLLNHSAPDNQVRVLVLLGLISASLLVMSGFTPAALVKLADIAEDYPEGRGSLMGLYSVFLGVGQFIGSGLGGPFASWRGVDGMILLTGLLGIVAAVFVSVLAKTDRRRVDESQARPAVQRRSLGIH